MQANTPKIADQEAAALLKKFSQLRDKKNPAVLANPSRQVPTVVIIGGGISGISAALTLAHAGLHVCMLEARDRIGGRIHTQELDNGAYVEYGAQFMHGIKGNPLFVALGKYHAELKPLTRERCAVYDENGHRIEHDKLLSHIQKVKDEVTSLAQQRLSDSKDRFLAEELKDIAEQVQYVSNLDPKHINDLIKKISLHEFHQETMFAYKLGLGKKESEGNYLITSGFANSLKEMLEEAKVTGNLELHLSSEVTQIKHDSNQVMVHMAQGNVFKADACICTLPLGVLQHGNVAFIPPLTDAKQKSIMRLKMTTHDKVIFSFEQAFWPNYSHFVIPFDPQQKTWVDVINLNYFTDGAAPVLVASVHDLQNSTNNTDETVIKQMGQLLQKIFDQYQQPKQTIVTHWNDDAYARGAYCYHTEHSNLNDNTEIARPMGRLCFAGEHTHRAPASVQGAYISGLEAAKQVVMQLDGMLSLEV